MLFHCQMKRGLINSQTHFCISGIIRLSSFGHTSQQGRDHSILLEQVDLAYQLWH